jgi:regulatory protein
MPGGRRARTGRGWDAAPARRDSGTGRGGARGRSGRDAETPPAPAEVDPAERARQICLNQLAVRPRTRAELAAAMDRRGVDPEVAAAVLDRYSDVGMIDDAAFARAWVSSRHHGRGLARRALASELRRKGVDAEEVSAALDDLDGETEERTARELVARRLRTAGRGEPEAVFRRLVGMLARKGYPPGLAIRVVKEVLAERADTAAFADDLDADALADQVGELRVD